MGEAVKNVRATGGIKEVTWEIVMTTESADDSEARPRFTKTDFEVALKKASARQKRT